MSVSSIASALRKSRRLSDHPSLQQDLSAQLTLPEECDLVANTFVIFKWQDQCCLLPLTKLAFCTKVHNKNPLTFHIAVFVRHKAFNARDDTTSTCLIR